MIVVIPISQHLEKISTVYDMPRIIIRLKVFTNLIELDLKVVDLFLKSKKEPIYPSKSRIFFLYLVDLIFSLKKNSIRFFSNFHTRNQGPKIQFYQS